MEISKKNASLISTPRSSRNLVDMTRDMRESRPKSATCVSSVRRPISTASSSASSSRARRVTSVPATCSGGLDVPGVRVSGEVDYVVKMGAPSLLSASVVGGDPMLSE